MHTYEQDAREAELETGRRVWHEVSELKHVIHDEQNDALVDGLHKVLAAGSIGINVAKQCQIGYQEIHVEEKLRHEESLEPHD